MPLPLWAGYAIISALTTGAGLLIQEGYTRRGENFSQRMSDEQQQLANIQYEESMKKGQAAELANLELNKKYEYERLASRTPYGVGENRFKGGKK